MPRWAPRNLPLLRTLIDEEERWLAWRVKSDISEASLEARLERTAEYETNGDDPTSGGRVRASNLAKKELLRRQVERLRDALAGEDPTLIEYLLSERAALCWIDVHCCDLDVIAAERAARRAGPRTTIAERPRPSPLSLRAAEPGIGPPPVLGRDPGQRWRHLPGAGQGRQCRRSRCPDRSPCRSRVLTLLPYRQRPPVGVSRGRRVEMSA